ncbi:MAG: SH3 domain-containing protein [Nitrospinota bacterium]|nr:SH3 domain-containing protein [Nitrospinota bacterium]
MYSTRIIKSTALAYFFLIALSAAAWADPLYVEEKKARIRSGPGTGYTILWEAPRYSPLEYLAKYKDWFAVRDFQNDVGWVHKDSVAKGKAAIVIKSKVDIRKDPSVDSPIVFVVEKHYIFRVIRVKGNWLKIRDTDGEQGWIHGKLVWMAP